MQPRSLVPGYISGHHEPFLSTPMISVKWCVSSEVQVGAVATLGVTTLVSRIASKALSEAEAKEDE